MSTEPIINVARDGPWLPAFVRDNAWTQCTIEFNSYRLLIATLATNAKYLEQAENLATSAQSVIGVFRCAALIISDELKSAETSSRLQKVLIPGRSDWRPPAEWCEKKLSGWRHTSVLKLGALPLFLNYGVDVLIVDADWRITRNPIDSFRGCINGRRQLEIMGRRDDHFVNLGLLYVRSTPTTKRIAARAANRSFVAWDQAVLNEEFGGAADLSCCVAQTFFESHFKRSEKVHGMKKKQQPRCQIEGAADAAGASSSSQILGPPQTPEEGSLPMWLNGWSSRRFNELTSVYHHRCPNCYNKCSRTQCNIQPGAPSCRADAKYCHRGPRFKCEVVDPPGSKPPVKALPAASASDSTLESTKWKPADPRAVRAAAKRSSGHRDPAGLCKRHPKACAGGGGGGGGRHGGKHHKHGRATSVAAPSVGLHMPSSSLR